MSPIKRFFLAAGLSITTGAVAAPLADLCDGQLDGALHINNDIKIPDGFTAALGASFAAAIVNRKLKPA